MPMARKRANPKIFTKSIFWQQPFFRCFFKTLRVDSRERKRGRKAKKKDLYSSPLFPSVTLVKYRIYPCKFTGFLLFT